MAMAILHLQSWMAPDKVGWPLTQLPSNTAQGALVRKRLPATTGLWTQVRQGRKQILPAQDSFIFSGHSRSSGAFSLAPMYGKSQSGSGLSIAISVDLSAYHLRCVCMCIVFWGGPLCQC